VRPKDASVNLTNLHPAMRLVIEALDVVAKRYGLPEITLTSAQDGQHMHGSKHHQDAPDIPGEAVDARLRDFLDKITGDVRRLLEMTHPKTFDVVLEVTPTEVTCSGCGTLMRLKGTHLHIEHDPKDPT